MERVCLQIPEALRLNMLVLRAQMCFETRRLFCSLKKEKKKKNDFPGSMINQAGKQLRGKNGVNLERMAEPSSISFPCREPRRNLSSPCRCLFLSMSSVNKLKDKEVLKQRPQDCYALQPTASQGGM